MKSILVLLSLAGVLFAIQILHLSHLSKVDAQSSDALLFLAPLGAREKVAKDDTSLDANQIVGSGAGDKKESSEPIQAGRQQVDTDLVHNYKCYPPRHWSSPNITNTIVYIELAWVNLHSETFYSYVHYFCSCQSDKHPQWRLDTSSVPHFYFGPEDFVKDDLRRILHEYNQTTCGPILFGTPSDPKVTVHTTTYASDWYGRNQKFPHSDKMNQPGHIFICHNDAPMVEGVENIFFLTPAHSRYVFPSYFPSTIVERAQRSLEKKPNNPPVFLVMGSFHKRAGNQKRNVLSLKRAMAQHRDANFTIHFLGGGADDATNETLIDYIKEHFGVDYNKVRLTPNSEADVFMENVGAADVILPLVDETNFGIEYQNGKRLTSAVSWAL
jgi:hypothetical protein